jgi:hypothetical protein
MRLLLLVELSKGSMFAKEILRETDNCYTVISAFDTIGDFVAYEDELRSVKPIIVDKDFNPFPFPK